MYMVNNAGDKGLPCGVPPVILVLPITWLSTSMLNRLGASQSYIHSCSPLCPPSISLAYSRLTELNADCASLPTITPSPCCSAIYPISMTLSNAPLPFLPANALSCHSSSQPCNFSATIFSASFPTVFASTIGLHPFTAVWSFPGLGIITIFIPLHSSGILAEKLPLLLSSTAIVEPHKIWLHTHMREGHNSG